MHNWKRTATLLGVCLLVLAFVAWSAGAQSKKGSSKTSSKVGSQQPSSANDLLISNNMQQMFNQGRHIFRFDTFGDEAFWGTALHLHQALAGEKLGGVGPG